MTLAPIQDNPVGWSSIYPPDRMGNPDPDVSPVASRALMSDVQRLGLLGRRGPVTGADLPAVEARGQGLMDNAMTVAGAVNPVGIRAFHGSPHTFDRFDMSKLGTGEGAQAYGHGLYFAGNEKVARAYRDTLTPPGMRLTLPDGASVVASPSDGKFIAPVVDALKGIAGPDYMKQAFIKAHIAGETDVIGATMKNAFGDMHLSATDAAQARAMIERMATEAQPIVSALKIEKPGSMYEVNLRTSPERLLDWDKPLVQQPHVTERLPASLRDELLKIGEKTKSDWGDLGVGTSADQYATGQSLYRTLQKKADDAWFANPKPPPWRTTGINTAKALQKQGIDGIQYLDGGSRAAGEGSRNYVMFDDKLIDILRRYGLLGMIGGGAAGGGLLAQEPTR